MKKSGRDLRDFLEFVRRRRPRELLTIEEEISPEYELAALVTELAKRLRTPIIELRRVRGCQLPMVTNVCASLPRIARSIGHSPRQLEERLESAYDHLIPPERWTGPGSAPVQENVRRRDQVDLGLLPRCRYTASERRPYMAAALIVARDDASGVLNLSYHRLMLYGRRRTGIFMARSGHLWRIFAANAERGKATPIAVCNGLHPLWSLGSLAAGELELDELEVIGGLLGRPLEVVEGLVDPRLLVPARAELALEGRIRPDLKVLEGPFGEFTGYATHPAEQPVFEVEAMSWRDGAIYQDIISGTAEHLTLSGTALRVHLQRSLRERFPWVREVYLPAPMTLYLRVVKPAGGRRDVRALLRRVLSDEAYVKVAYCFDADVELRKPTSVAWAIATRSQADRDAVVLPGLPATDLDPSERDGMTCKWGLDATAKPDLDSFTPRNCVPEKVLAGLDVNRLLRRH